MKIKMYKQALKYYEKLDKNTKSRINKGIEGLLKTPPQGNIKSLKGEFEGLNRLQISDYRIIYVIDEGLLKITNILPRGDVYKRI